MKKSISIQGMSCGHCEARVSKALNGLAGVEATVDHKKGRAIVTVQGDVSDELLRETVTEAGYSVTDISEKKGLFGF